MELKTIGECRINKMLIEESTACAYAYKNQVVNIPLQNEGIR